MQRISNRHDDVEHFLFAELLAANAGKGLNTERPASGDASNDTDLDAVIDDAGSLAGPTSPNGWY